MTCPHCEELQHELDMLRREVRDDLDTATIGRLCLALRLSGTQGKLVAALHQANGRILSRQKIEDLVSRRGGYESNTVSVMISHIRDRIGYAAIETVNGIGYRLSEAGQVLVGAAVAEPERVAA